MTSKESSPSVLKVKTGDSLNSPTPQTLKQFERERKTLLDEIGKLNRTKNKLERQLVAASSERDTIQFSVREIKKEHKKELEELQKDMYQLHEKIRLMNAKLEKLPLIEQNIIDMFMEFREYPYEGEELQRQAAKERNALKSQSPIITLDCMRTNVRNLIAEHDSDATCLKHEITKASFEKEQLSTKASKQVDQLLATVQQSQHKAEDAVAQLQIVVEEKARLKRELETEISGLRTTVTDLKDIISSKDKDVNLLAEAVDTRDEILLAKEHRLVKITQLEQQITRDERLHKREMNNLKAQTHKQTIELKKETDSYVQQKSDNKKLKREIAELKQKLHNAKVSVNRSNVIEMETRVKKAEQQSQLKNEQIQSLHKEVEELNKQNEELKRKGNNMKDEYIKLFAAVQKEQEKRQDDDHKILVDHSRDRYVGKESALTMQQLKAELEDKNRECEKLHRRLKKLVLQEHRDQKYYEYERDVLLGEIHDTQIENEKLGGPPPKIVALDRDQFRAKRPNTAGGALNTKSSSKKQKEKEEKEKEEKRRKSSTASHRQNGPPQPLQSATMADASSNASFDALDAPLGTHSISTDTGSITLDSAVRKRLPLGDIGGARNNFTPALLHLAPGWQ